MDAAVSRYNRDGRGRHVSGKRRRTPLGILITAIMVVAAAIGTIWAIISGNQSGNQPLLSAGFDQPNGLVTNEFAYYNPGDHVSVESPVWLLTSGSLFARDGAGWTGVPDIGRPDPASSKFTDSSVFRAVTRRNDFGNVVVSFSLFIQRFVAPGGQAAPSWRGVHVFLRYQSADLLYVLSVDRSDGIIVIKKKVPGPEANGGIYSTLASTRHRAVTGRWETVTASVTNQGEGVALTVSIDGAVVLRAVDSGSGHSPPITQPGRVGLRGDYTQFMFRNFKVTAG